MKNQCCTKSQAKAKKEKKPKKVEEQPNEKGVVKKQEEKVSEKEKPKTDSKKEETDVKEKENKILTWQHSSTKKERSFVTNNEKSYGNNLMSHQNGFSHPFYPPRSMRSHAGTNPLNWWPVNPVPRGGYPAFTEPPPMCEPIHPYQHMARPPIFDGAYMSPYPPMAAAPYSYWHFRPDTNPMKRYTSYIDNYTYHMY